jgi:hypothetical protein
MREAFGEAVRSIDPKTINTLRPTAQGKKGRKIRKCVSYGFGINVSAPMRPNKASGPWGSWGVGTPAPRSALTSLNHGESGSSRRIEIERISRLT